MSIIMNEIKFTPKIIIAIMWKQAMMMNRYTSTFITFCLLCTWGVMKLLGRDFNWHILVEYKIWFIISVILIHFIPVNYVCTKRTLAAKFKGFRLMATTPEKNNSRI